MLCGGRHGSLDCCCMQHRPDCGAVDRRFRSRKGDEEEDREGRIRAGSRLRTVTGAGEAAQAIEDGTVALVAYALAPIFDSVPETRFARLLRCMIQSSSASAAISTAGIGC